MIIESIANYIREQAKERQNLKLLQLSYLIVGITALLIAGLVGLINQPLGIGILIVPLVAFAALSLNIVAWALVKLAIDAISQAKHKKPSNDQAK